MENKDLIIEEALQLCIEILKNNSDPLNTYCYAIITMEELDEKYSEIRQYKYSYTETPEYLFRQNVLVTNDELLSWYLKKNRVPEGKLLPKGLHIAMMDKSKAQKWVKKVLDKRIPKEEEATLKEVWNARFRFDTISNTLFLPPYGKCIFSDKNIPTTATVNQRALFTRIICDAQREGISAHAINTKFKQEGLQKVDHRRIDAVVVAINKRFKQCFPGANVQIKNIGKNGIKKLKLSVQPLKK